MTADLVAFLRARLDEDEQAARGLQGAAKMLDKEPDFYGAGGPAAEAYWEHLAPHRVLAEVDAKRRILAEHPWRHEPDWPSGRQCTQCATEHPCTTLRLLALPYAGHPSYRPEWAPSS